MKKEIIISEDFEKNANTGCMSIVSFLLVLGLTIASVYLTVNGRAQNLLLISIFFVIATIIVGIRTISKIQKNFKSTINPQEVLIINDEGITHKKLYGFIPWSQIADVSCRRDTEHDVKATGGIGTLLTAYAITEIRDVQVVALTLKDNESILRNLPPKEQQLAIEKCRRGDPFVVIHDLELDASSQEIYEMIKERLDWYQNRKIEED